MLFQSDWQTLKLLVHSSFDRWWFWSFFFGKVVNQWHSGINSVFGYLVDLHWPWTMWHFYLGWWSDILLIHSRCLQSTLWCSVARYLILSTNPTFFISNCQCIFQLNNQILYVITRIQNHKKIIIFREQCKQRNTNNYGMACRATVRHNLSLV